MSLVREALARAEREAAARAAAEKGLPPALANVAQPYRARRRSRGPWLAGLAAAALAGATVAAVLLGSRGREARDSPSQPPATPATAPTTAGERPASTKEEAPPAVAESAAIPTPPARTESASIPAGSPAARAATPPAPEAGATAASAQPSALDAEPPATSELSAPPPPSSPSRPELAASPVRELALGDGRTIRLGGIAYSEAAPLAYLNGRLHGVGESVEGWRIVAIERERVILESGGRRVAVRLR